MVTMKTTLNLSSVFVFLRGSRTLADISDRKIKFLRMFFFSVFFQGFFEERHSNV